jgi:two-component system sensor histidine kinase HupT/HoxJ
MTESSSRPPRTSPLDDPQRRRLLGEEARLEGVEEDTWIDVIQKMDEVYSQLLRDEVALEEKNAQLELSQQFIFSLLSAMSDVLVACDHHGAIEETNAALRELIGRSDAELQGSSVYALLAGEEAVARVRGIVELRAAPRASDTVEVELLDAQGRAVPVDFNCSPRVDGNGRRVGTVLVGRPTAEIKRAYRELREAHEALKRTQQQLLHSEKLASLGRLVAGVAHELNNPISFVLGNVNALQRYGQRLSQYLEAVHGQEDAATLAALRRSLRIDHLLADLPSLIAGMLEGAQRTADIVQGLKRFSAVDREEHVEVDLNAVIQRAIHWVCKGTAQDFHVTWSPALGECTVLGSTGQLMQVVMNLIQNAYDAASASPRDKSPALSIHSEIIGDKVKVYFQDNGPGIPEAVLSRVFDPFFTTKPVGKGTGLGLSISYGIVERQGGKLTAGNSRGGGAVFELELPARGTKSS